MKACPLCNSFLHYGELDGRRVLLCILHGEQATLEARQTMKQDVEKAWQHAHQQREFKNEAAFQANVIRYAIECGWDKELIYHPYDSRKSTQGFPDLIFTGRRTIFAELKMPGNYPTENQKKWLTSLRCAGNEVYLWYPKDWQEIESTLARLS